MYLARCAPFFLALTMLASAGCGTGEEKVDFTLSVYEQVGGDYVPLADFGAADAQVLDLSNAYTITSEPGALSYIEAPAMGQTLLALSYCGSVASGGTLDWLHSYYDCPDATHARTLRLFTFDALWGPAAFRAVVELLEVARNGGVLRRDSLLLGRNDLVPAGTPVSFTLADVGYHMPELDWFRNGHLFLKLQNRGADDSLVPLLVLQYPGLPSEPLNLAVFRFHPLAADRSLYEARPGVPYGDLSRINMHLRHEGAALEAFRFYLFLVRI